MNYSYAIASWPFSLLPKMTRPKSDRKASFSNGAKFHHQQKCRTIQKPTLWLLILCFDRAKWKIPRLIHVETSKRQLCGCYLEIGRNAQPIIIWTVMVWLNERWWSVMRNNTETTLSHTFDRISKSTATINQNNKQIVPSWSLALWSP